MPPSSHPLFEDNKAINHFEKKNGKKLKDMPLKELTLLLHNEGTKRYEKIEKTMDELTKWCRDTYEKEIEKRNKVLSKITNKLTAHDSIIQEMFTKFPEKGWCERVEDTLFPKQPEVPLAYKVNRMWHNWRLIKLVILAIFAVGGINIIVELWPK